MSARQVVWQVILGAMMVAGSGAAASGPAPQPQPYHPAEQNLAGLSDDDTSALVEVRDFLEQLAADDNEADDLRLVALTALERIHEALNDWNRPGLVEWYLDLLGRPRAGRLEGAILRGGQAAARAGQYHLGGVREFWKKADTVIRDDGTPDRPAERARKEFAARTAALDKPVKLGAYLKPITITPRKMTLSTVKPYPEPKSEKPKK